MPVFTSSIEVTADYPTIKPSLNLNFARSRSLDPRITFERASVGTYVGRDGLIKTAGEDEARFDHDPETLESLGLLIEESRTNILPYSSDIVGQANWSRSGVTTVAATSITAPDGSTDTVGLRSDGTNGQHTLYDDISVSNIAAVYTASCWVKEGTKDFAELFANGAGGTGTITIAYKYDLVNKTVEYTGTGGFSAGTSATITEYPNGWFRITMTGDVADTATGAGTYRFHVRARTDVSGNYQGDNTDGIYIWGPQVELGAFPTSYIPTSGAAVTRTEDKADIRGDAFQSIFNSNFNEFSGVIEFDNDDLPNPPANYYSIFELWGENTNFENRIQITRENDGLPWGIETRAFGSNTALFSNGNISGSNTAALKKLAFSWNIPDYSTTTGRRWAFSFSGETVDLVPNNNGAGLPQVTRMGIGYSPTRNEGQSKTHFKRITIYPKALTDAQLQLLTS